MGQSLNQDTIELPIQQTLDLASSLESGQAHRWGREKEQSAAPPGRWHWGVIEGNVVKIRARSGSQRTGSMSDGPVLQVRSAPPRDSGYLHRVLRSYFRLDDDIEAIYEDITRDPRVAGMVREYRGLRLLRIEPWECLIAFICSANSNLPRIHANVESISEGFGHPVALDGQIRYTFPQPEQLARAGESALRDLGLGFRAPYVAETARVVAGGGLDLESLRLLSYVEAKERLMELPGVGTKIADCVLLHSLDKLEAFPVDVWIRRALSEWYFTGEKPPPDRTLVAWAQEHFGRYAGYAQLYLFHGRRLHKA